MNKILISIIPVVLLFSGCRVDEKPVTPTPPPPGNEITLEDKVTELENSGDLPVLDRSDSIAGPDRDNNGIRDDIDYYISGLDFTEAQKKAIRQLARSHQASLLVDVADSESVRQVSKKLFNATQCMNIRFPDGDEDFEILVEVSRIIEAFTANTKLRADKYIQYNLAVSGSVSKLPSGDTCDE